MASTIFSGNDIKLLKSNLDFNGKSKILSGTVDPSSVATSAPFGSLYLNSSTGFIYRKKDSGSSTNWSKLVDSSSYITLRSYTISSQSASTSVPTIMQLETTEFDSANAWTNATILTTTGNTHSNTTLDTLASTTGLVAGMSITGSGIPAGTTILSIAASTVTMSAAASTTLTGTSITFKCTQYTVPVTGTYLSTGLFRLASAAMTVGTAISLQLTRAGTEIARIGQSYAQVSASYPVTVGGSTLVALTQNDVIRVVINQSLTATSNLSATGIVLNSFCLTWVGN